MFWFWVFLAVLLGITELFTGGYFALPVALAAGVTAIVTYLGTPLIWQLVCFGVLSALLFGIMHQAGRRMANQPPDAIAGNRLIGKRGCVTETISADGRRGMVRVEREDWRADTTGNVELAEGRPVEVIAIEGTHVVVRPVPEAAPSDAEDLHPPASEEG